MVGFLFAKVYLFWISSGVFHVINVIRNINCTMCDDMDEMFTATARGGKNVPTIKVYIACVEIEAATRTPMRSNWKAACIT